MTRGVPLEGFSAAWTALSRLLLRPPTASDLASVRDPELLAVWPLARDAATTRGLALLGASTEDEEQVRRDPHRLFVGPRPAPAPPYESVHRSRERLLFDTETLQVRGWYARFGVRAPRLHAEPDDHVGLELEFLAHLASLGAVAELGEFVAEHVATWVPGFAALVVEHAETDFHRGVGHLLAGAIEQTAAEFGAVATSGGRS